jgi:hypothetical protein
MKKQCVLALTLTLAACLVNPTVGEVVDDFGPPFCDRVKECNPGTFELAYPGGQADCVNKAREALKKQKGNDVLEKRSVCTQEEVDICVEDVKKVECSTLSSPPPSCNKC